MVRSSPSCNTEVVVLLCGVQLLKHDVYAPSEHLSPPESMFSKGKGKSQGSGNVMIRNNANEKNMLE